MNYIDHRLIKKSIPAKGQGFIAAKDIPKDTIIIKEHPAFSLNSSDTISDMFQLLYQVFTSEDKDKIKAFYKLAPKNTNKHLHYSKNVRSELIRLKKSKLRYIYDYFKENFSDEEILLYCAKYMCNAFNFPKLVKNGDPIEGCAILFTGTILNHSCSPNVDFKRVGNSMHFITLRDIKAGEEICDNYVDIDLNKKRRQRRLLDQYGFLCECEKCYSG